MKGKPFFTRKNYIVIGCTLLYSLLFTFTGLCVDYSSGLFSKKNFIALVAKALGYNPSALTKTAYVLLALVALYILVCVIAIIYEGRYAITNKTKLYSFKMIVVYIITIIICLALSFGVAFLIQIPITKDIILKNLKFIGVVFLISAVIYAAIFFTVMAVVMLYINFKYIDQPFKMFSQSSMIEFEDKDNDIIKNFSDDKAISIQKETQVQSGAVVTGGMVNTGVSASAQTKVMDEVVKLDDREKVFPALSRIDKKYNGFSIDKVYSDDLSLEELVNGFRNYLAKVEHLYFDLTTIRLFVSGLATSHLLILEGLSGTGKSSLPRYFAKYVTGMVTFIPVQTTWRDKSSVIGYFNEFSRTYNETTFLTSLYEASYNPDMINIFVLDEMNISRIEYYFADFLSVLEYPKDDWKIKLMNFPSDFIPPLKIEDGSALINENSFFIGTANKDDSTFIITDKVYDRAITIDFDRNNVEFLVEGDYSPIALSYSKLKSLFKEAKENTTYNLTDVDLSNFLSLCDFMYETFDVTIGNRIINQIKNITPIYIATGGSKEEILDIIFSKKVLSKLNGRFEDFIKPSLSTLKLKINAIYGENTFNKSIATIDQLIRKL